ncbi:hypothetical protein TNCT_306501 [Trichonephila clavata]|uniref:Uncharacterized protein n=1 Tax=Trichonephila clavata TaxID=2740835 RepID=A0A8X6GFY1_TRICU|nr:hypothetical protein TNCT_306501 [Trichonephila clavata]
MGPEKDGKKERGRPPPPFWAAAEESLRVKPEPRAGCPRPSVSGKCFRGLKEKVGNSSHPLKHQLKQEWNWTLVTPNEHF